MQHGMGGYALGYLTDTMCDLHMGCDPMVKALALKGFDVYMANNSGVKYSQQHDVYTVDDPEFWDIDMYTKGVYDFPALVTEIQRRTGVKKVAMFGHSEGTSQLYAGMGSIPEWYDENVSIGLLWGPCTTPTETYLKEVYTEDNWNFLIENDIYVLGGPNWYTRDKQLFLDSGIQTLIDAIPAAEGLPNNPIKSVASFSQKAFSKRFQEYYEGDWFAYVREHGDTPKTPLMDFGLAQKTNVGLYIGLWDNTCPLPVAMEQRQQLGEN